MTDTALVEIMNGQALTTSLKVAEAFEKPHKNVLTQIRNLAAEILATTIDTHYNPLFTETSYVDDRGKTYPMFIMNRDGFIELVGNMNGAKARVWKRKYLAAFNAMEEKLKELEIARIAKDEQWALLRNSTKKNFRKLTDAIKNVIIPLARKQGSKTPDDIFYMNYAKMINKILGCKAGERDDLDITQLNMLDLFEKVGCMKIYCLGAAEVDHKQIYKDTKFSLEDFARISLITEAFRPQTMLS